MKRHAKKLPPKLDEFGNAITTLLIPDMDSAYRLAQRSGCVNFDFFDVCFTSYGEGVSFSYVEGDCSVAKGENAIKAYQAFIDFANENY